MTSKHEKNGKGFPCHIKLFFMFVSSIFFGEKRVLSQPDIQDLKFLKRAYLFGVFLEVRAGATLQRNGCAGSIN